MSLEIPFSRLVFTVLRNAALSQKILILPSVVVGPVWKDLLEELFNVLWGFSWASPNDNHICCTVKSTYTSNAVKSKHTDKCE